MTKLSALTVILAAASFAPTLSFTPVSPIASKPCTTLRLSNNQNEDVVKTIGSSMVAASLMVSTLFTPDAVIAAQSTTDFNFGPTSSLVAGRSGGRAGGRSSASSMRAPPPRASSTTINRTTVIHSPTSPSVIVAPPPVVVGSPIGFGYSPFAPSPLGIGLGIAGEVGREMREYSQENQIREARAAAQQSQQREYALEQRLAQLEAQQNAQNAANAAAAAAANVAR